MNGTSRNAGKIKRLGNNLHQESVGAIRRTVGTVNERWMCRPVRLWLKPHAKKGKALGMIQFWMPLDWWRLDVKFDNRNRLVKKHIDCGVAKRINIMYILAEEPNLCGDGFRCKTQTSNDGALNPYHPRSPHGLAGSSITSSMIECIRIFASAGRFFLAGLRMTED